MYLKYLGILSIAVLCSINADAQNIVYSQPDKDQVRGATFEVIGKMADHYILYNNLRSDRYMYLYDTDMKLISKTRIQNIPDKLISTDFIELRDSFYMIYQYQHRNIVYCEAAIFDANARMVGMPRVLDTTAINFFANNKLYTLLYSEDKNRIAVIKINSRNPVNFVVTSSLFTRSLDRISKTTSNIPIPGRNDFLTEFNLDNAGDLAFIRASGNSDNDNINALVLLTKKPLEDSISAHSLDVANIYLSDIRMKVDNINGHYLIASFYSKNRRGNIDGLYCALWDKNNDSLISTRYNTFSDNLRNEAKGQGDNLRTAFDNYFLQNIIMRKDGGYLLAAESTYSSSHGAPINRWDYLYGMPYLSPAYYYNFNPYGYYSPWGFSPFSQSTRYYADNITILSFDPGGNVEWSNVINKSQFDDNTDDFIGYTILNTGGEIHFLFNQLERRVLLLTDQAITPDGQLHRSPTFRDLDNGYQFMSRYAKQVGPRELIIPCQYRNYICFAKVDL